MASTAQSMRPRASGRRNRARKIHLRQHPAAENITIYIGVSRHRLGAQCRLLIRWAVSPDHLAATLQHIVVNHQEAYRMCLRDRSLLL